MYSLQLGIYLGFVDTWLNKLGTVCQDNERLKLRSVLLYITLLYSYVHPTYRLTVVFNKILSLSQFISIEF